MNLYDDEALKQEVIYLHSLWHQGPPGRNPVFDPLPRPEPNYIPPENLRCLSSPYGPVRLQHGSRNPKHRRHPYKRPGHERGVQDPGREWPTNETPPSPMTASGWREFKPNPNQKLRPVPADEQARVAAIKLQKKVLGICRQFFAGKSAEEEVGDGDEADADLGDEDLLPEKDVSSAAFEFFSRLFEENSELKSYYQKNAGNGEFSCLVCGGTTRKTGRKFKNRLALVQHSLTIHKTNMKSVHRDFAQVICNVLGWDINNPVASSMKDAQDLQVPGVSANVDWPSGWPPSPKEHLDKRGISAEEQGSFAVLQMQQKASEACKEFFAENDDSDDESEEENDHIDENQSEEFKFFLRIFSESEELKSYYENNHESGDFICLVCAGIGKRVWKRFKDCAGLLQHSTQVQNAKKKWAHRTYAQAICEVLSWDFGCLRLMVAKGSDPLVVSNANQNDEALSAVDEVNNVDFQEPLFENQASKGTNNNGEACLGSSV